MEDLSRDRVMHEEKLDIKQELQPLVIPEVNKELEIQQPDEKNCRKNVSKRRKMSTRITSVHEGKEQYKCGICDPIFGQNFHLNRHVATVHEGNKQFKCSICNTYFG